MPSDYSRLAAESGQTLANKSGFSGGMPVGLQELLRLTRKGRWMGWDEKGSSTNQD